MEGDDTAELEVLKGPIEKTSGRFGPGRLDDRVIWSNKVNN